MEFVAEQTATQEEVKDTQSEAVEAQDSNPEPKPAVNTSSDESDGAEEAVKFDNIRIDDQSEEERQRKKAAERVRQLLHQSHFYVHNALTRTFFLLFVLEFYP